MEKQQNIPQLRFPEFEGEWKSNKLKTLVTESRLGGNYENIESNSGIPLIKMGNIGRGNIILDKIQNIPKNLEFDKADILKEGDLLFNTRNTLELVGKVSIWRNELPLALYNSNLMRLKFNNKIESSNRFVNYLFNTKPTIKRLRRYATGTTSVAAIYGRDLNNLKIVYPTLPNNKK
ncbi:restriction endonuclease subunit S domain-containing protein [Draconibacterium halophilum]|uniref:restriction endonuclease subunit S n=1 Tax=Draconibacterium halophilum TaxID=2706887 RepID=UPI0019401630|nr:restriction endonuclease subunit S [Draconibacterium halophilum]